MISSSKGGQKDIEKKLSKRIVKSEKELWGTKEEQSEGKRIRE